MREFVVIGLGRFGSSVATTLSELGCNVLAIDQNEEKVQALKDIVTQAVQLDATDEKALRVVGVQNVDVAIVSIGQDIEASIMVTLNLKELEIKEIVAKAINPMHGKVLQKLGVDKIIYPERDAAVRLAKSLVAPKVLEHFELAPEYSIVEMIAPPEFVGEPLRKLKIREKYGINVIAIRRKVPKLTETGETDFEEEVNVVPNAKDEINEGDILVMLGKNEQIEKIKKK